MSVTDNITNISSNIESGNNLILSSGNNTNIIGSKISVENDININADHNINIVNAVDSSYHSVESHKKGSVKTSSSTRVDYIETAAKSDISATNINLSANNNILIQSSDINTNNNLNIGTLTLLQNPDGSYQTDANGNYLTGQNNLVQNLVIQNDILNEYHYANTSNSYHGIAKVGANITSFSMGMADMIFNYAHNIISPLNKAIDDPIQKVASKFLPDSITDKIDANYLRDQKNDLKDNSLYNIKQKTNDSTNITNIASSNINAGNNLNINTNQNTIIQASNINAGTSDTTTDKSNPAIQGQVNIEANNLHILADQSSSITTHEEKTTRTLSFNNWNDGSFNTDTTNTKLSAKNDGFNFNIANNINTSYNSKLFDSNSGSLNTQTKEISAEELSGLNYLTYLHNNKTNVLYAPITDSSKNWADNNRGLTDAGTAAVAVAAVAATILTAGAAAPVTATAAAAGTVSAATATFAVTTAVASSAMATASVSATNTSMNAEGDLAKQTKDIGEQTAKDTTSDEALKSYAIAGGTALLTFGLTSGIDKIAVATNTTAQANSTIGTALKDSLVQSVSSSAAQSTINGDSFSETFKESTRNLLINAVGEIAANQIGKAAHGSITVDQNGHMISYTAPTINTTTQLTLHAALGCAMNAAGGNNCAAGAASGVIGESLGAFLKDNTDLTNAQIIEASKLAGALTSAGIVGPDDGASVFAGSQVGRNAGENNATYVDRNRKIIDVDIKDKDTGIYEVTDASNLNKDNKIAYSLRLEEFEHFDADDYKQNGKSPSINTDLKMDVIGFSDELNNRYDLADIINGFRNNGDFDIKQKLINLGYTHTQLDGIVVGERDGLPVIASARTIGNFSAGRTIASEALYHSLGEVVEVGNSAAKTNFGAGPFANTLISTQWGADLIAKIGMGVYNMKQNGFESATYFGENPYSGRAINIGIDSLVTQPVRLIPKQSLSNNVINNLINPTSQQNISTPSIVTREDILRQYLK
ncbi:MAG: putative hemagglutinin [Rickettsiaceae bacterium]|nr:putative hemagglutinin [Rickettsiaceae bacterium]